MTDEEKDRLIEALQGIVRSMTKKIIEQDKQILNLESTVQMTSLQHIKTGLKQLYL